MTLKSLTVSQELLIPVSELSFTASRSGGPGGQHVNKTNSRVDVRWNIATSQSLTESQRALLIKCLAKRINQEGELSVVVDSERSQTRNLTTACELMVLLIQKALQKRKRRVGTKPTRSSQERRLAHKRAHSQTKSARQRVTQE